MTLFSALVTIEEPRSQGLSKAQRDLMLLQTVFGDDDYSSAMLTYEDLVLVCNYDMESCDQSSWTVRVRGTVKSL